MTESDLAAAAQHEIATLPPCTIQWTPRALLHATALFQLAARHPNVDETHRIFIRTFVAQARDYFHACPSVLELLQRGDLPPEDPS